MAAPPSRYCSSHPHGSAGPCRFCGHARATYAQWLTERAVANLAPVTRPSSSRPWLAALQVLIGTPDPEASHRGYLAATAALAARRGSGRLSAPGPTLAAEVRPPPPAGPGLTVGPGQEGVGDG